MIRLLLLLYPASFRAEYGAEIRRVYEARRRDAGFFGVLALWAETIADTIPAAMATHWDILRSDVVYTIRSLRAAPGFTLTALAVTALGIGATTAAFSVTDHVLLRPLPFPQSDRLVMLWEDRSSTGYSRLEPSPATFRDWKERARSFTRVAAWHGQSVNLTGDGEPLRVEGSAMTFDLLDVLGVQPSIGHNFTEADDREGAPGTVILSDALWKRRFGGDPAVLGRKLMLDDEPFTIIGVMPATFNFPRRTIELWLPARFRADDFGDRTNAWLNVAARLRPGVTIENARAEMRTIAAQLARELPKEMKDAGVTLRRLDDQIGNGQRSLLLALLGASLCVLLIGCSNLANLLLSRAMVRRKEIAVRTALGAGRERLVRQLLTESLTLSLCGAALGVAIASQAIPLLAKLVPNGLPIADVPSIDWRILSFALVLAVITGLAFGVAPALRGCAGGAISGLHEGSRGGVGGRRERTRAALVVTEVACSVVLLVSSGLLMRALLRVESVDPGFRPGGVVSLRTWLPWPAYGVTSKRVQFYNRVLEQVRALPGVKAASYISFLPMSGFGGGIFGVKVPGYQGSPSGQNASIRFVTPGYFETLGIPIKMGRDVSAHDTRESQFVAVVSESFANQYWPGQDPIGRAFNFAFTDRTVAGVVADVRVRGLERPSEPQVYLPAPQVPDYWLTIFAPKDLAVLASGSPASLVPAIRRAIASVDPNQPISDVHLLEDFIDADTAPRRVQVRVLGAFAAIAFLLAAIGIHGLLSFAVSTRAQEIGVRMALGARRGNIVAMIAGSALRLSAVGVVVGAVLAIFAGRALQSLLAGVNLAESWMVFGAAIGLAIVMTLAGAMLPALRAIRVDPVTVMRSE